MPFGRGSEKEVTKMNLMTKLFRRRIWSDLAIETFERQVALKEKQDTIAASVRAKWAAKKEKEVPHKQVVYLDLYRPAPATISVEFGPPPTLEERK